jgi:uncharacterized membrane protein YtjA (UPF0391 family)
VQPGSLILRSTRSFFQLTIGAASFGFTGIAGFSAIIARALMAIFVALFLLSLLVHSIEGSLTPSVAQYW